MTKSYGGVTVGLTGEEEFKANLMRLAAEYPSRAHADLLAEAETLIPLLEEAAPIGAAGSRHRGDPHPGRLRGSAHVVDVPGYEMSVALVMGGDGAPDGDVPYALAQESRSRYDHPHGGHAHYFGETIHAEQPLFANRMAGRLLISLEDTAR